MDARNRNRSILVRTYKPEDVKSIIAMHKRLYELEYGFGSLFVEYVEKHMLQFNEKHDGNREGIWVAEADGASVGVIAIVKADNSTAQLRWFLINPEMRGRGLGHELLQTAMEFCHEKQYKGIMLWTVSVLDAARHLYQKYGFVLSETKPNYTWAKGLTEERWDLRFNEH